MNGINNLVLANEPKVSLGDIGTHETFTRELFARFYRELMTATYAPAPCLKKGSILGVPTSQEAEEEKEIASLIQASAQPNKRQRVEPSSFMSIVPYEEVQDKTAYVYAAL